jgi:PAS domain S-box-containing protein
MSPSAKTQRALLEEIAELKARLGEAEETLEAIRSGTIDALVVQGPEGEQVFTLRGADQTYRALVEAMNEGAVTLTPEGTVLYCNQRFADIVETPLEKVIGSLFFGFVPVGCREQCCQFLTVSCGRRATLEVLLSTGQDRAIFAHLSSNPFALDNATGISLVVTDITALKKAGEDLRRSEERFQSVARITTDAIWEWDALTRMAWRSEGFSTTFLHSPSTIGSDYQWWFDHVHPEDRAAVMESFQKFVRSKDERWSEIYRFRRGDGTYAEVHDRGNAVRDERGVLLRIVGTLADITEQRKAERVKRELSKNILHAQEQERRRVARELHDGVNQLLSSSKFRLHAVEQTISNRDKSLGRKVKLAKQLVDKAITEVRAISRNLRPSELDDLGLTAALRSLCDDFERRTELAVKLESSLPDGTLSNTTELTLYRISQEALNNIEKHAGATQVSIHIARNQKVATLVIRDNGRGFDPGRVRRTKTSGWGLENMRERASYAGGEMTVKSVPEKGTEIVLQIPIL